ncbi:MAG: hypothetical protein IJS15_14690 [Victivallales bacterium]|nr:hypothetical protein [Victivallales bacterium]
MNKLFSLFLFFGFIISAADFEVSSKLPQGQIYKAGSKIPVTISWKCPEGYAMAAWKIGAYLPSLPYKFAEATNHKISVNKDPKWSAITTVPWKWLKKEERGKLTTLDISFDTKDWPKGDYRLQCTILIRVDDKPEDKTDKYIATGFIFTLE